MAARFATHLTNTVEYTVIAVFVVGHPAVGSKRIRLLLELLANHYLVRPILCERAGKEARLATFCILRRLRRLDDPLKIRAWLLLLIAAGLALDVIGERIPERRLPTQDTVTPFIYVLALRVDLGASRFNIDSRHGRRDFVLLFLNPFLLRPLRAPGRRLSRGCLLTQ